MTTRSRSTRARPDPGRDTASGPLRRQLILLAGLLSLLVAGALVLVVHTAVAGSNESTVDQVLRDRTTEVVRATDRATEGASLRVPGAVLEPGTAVYDAQGRRISGQVPGPLRAQFAELSTSDQPTTLRVGEDYQVLSTPFTTAAGPAGVSVSAERLQPYEAIEHTATLVSVLAGGIVVLLALALTAWSSRRALAPVARMARTAEEWSEHDLDRRFDLGPPTNEITELGHTLDGLLAKVAGVIRDEQRLTSELAHELRSPLTAVKGNVELLLMRRDLDRELREDLTEVQSSCQQMTATISGLLALARAQTDPTRTQSCNLRSLMREVMGRSGILSPVVEIEPGLRVAAPEELVRRAVAPVVENAVRHSSAVTVEAEQVSGVVHLRVHDEGPGVPADKAGHIFDPGYTSGRGSGLGLALARRVARSIGGEVTLDATGPETAAAGPRGATFLIALPGR